MGKDLKAALALFEKAAAKNHVPAQTNLGLKYRTGIGVTRNPKLATEWFTKVAANGDAMAKAELKKLGK